MSEKVFGPWVHFPEMYSTLDGALIFVIESIHHETSSTSSLPGSKAEWRGKKPCTRDKK